MNLQSASAKRYAFESLDVSSPLRYICNWGGVFVQVKTQLTYDVVLIYADDMFRRLQSAIFRPQAI